MVAAACTLLLAYAAVNAFGAWAVGRRRRSLSMGYMVVATLLVVAAVAVAFGHWVGLPLTVVGVVGSSLAALAEGRSRIRPAGPGRPLLRAAGGLAVLAAVVLARPPLL